MSDEELKVSELIEESEKANTCPAIKQQLFQYLDRFICGEKSKFPNVQFTNGTIGQTYCISIPEDEYVAFLDMLARAAEQKEKFCIDEKVENAQFKFFMDLDINIDDNVRKEFQKTDFDLALILKEIVNIVSDFFPQLKRANTKETNWNSNDAYLDMEKLCWYGGWKRNGNEDPFQSVDFSRLYSLACISKTSNKIGIHLYWIGAILVTYEQALTIVHNTILTMTKKFPNFPLPWDKVIDTSIYKLGGSGMRMIHTHKYESCTVCKGSGKYVYSPNDFQGELQPTGPQKKRTCSKCSGEKGIYVEKVYRPTLLLDGHGEIVNKDKPSAAFREKRKHVLPLEWLFHNIRQQFYATSIKTAARSQIPSFYQEPEHAVHPSFSNVQKREFRKVKQLTQNQPVDLEDIFCAGGLSNMTNRAAKHLEKDSQLGKLLEKEIQRLCPEWASIAVSSIKFQPASHTSSWSLTILVHNEGSSHCEIKKDRHSKNSKIYFVVSGSRQEIRQKCLSNQCNKKRTTWKLSDRLVYLLDENRLSYKTKKTLIEQHLITKQQAKPVPTPEVVKPSPVAVSSKEEEQKPRVQLQTLLQHPVLGVTGFSSMNRKSIDNQAEMFQKSFFQSQAHVFAKSHDFKATMKRSIVSNKTTSKRKYIDLLE